MQLEQSPSTWRNRALNVVNMMKTAEEPGSESTLPFGVWARLSQEWIPGGLPVEHPYGKSLPMMVICGCESPSSLQAAHIPGFSLPKHLARYSECVQEICKAAFRTGCTCLGCYQVLGTINSLASLMCLDGPISKHVLVTRAGY
jgi:hypothetical protein